MLALIIFGIPGMQPAYGQSSDKLSPNINLPENKNKMPFVDYTGTKMIFIRQSADREFVYESSKDESGTWSEAKPVNAINNFVGNDYIIESPSYNQDVSVIYFSLKHVHKDSSADIYSCRKINGVRQEPKKINGLVNSSADETDPCISPDGKTLYFARKNTDETFKKYECYTIFRSRLSDSVWLKPESLPEPVNEVCDRFPRISADGKTLFLTSVRNSDDTGSDIYYAKELAKNVWLSPVLMDSLQSKEDESSPSCDINGNIYFARNTGSRKKDPVYIHRQGLSQKFLPDNALIIMGEIRDQKNNKVLPANIRLIDPNSSVILAKAKADALTGKYRLTLPESRNYRIDVFSKAYSHHFSNYNIRELNKNKIIEENVLLFPEVSLIVNAFDAEIFRPLDADMKIYNSSKEEIEVKAEKLSAGRKRFILPIGSKYRIQASKKYYENAEFVLDLSDVVIFDEFERDLELQPRKTELEIVLSDSETGEGVSTEVIITNSSTGEKRSISAETDQNGRLRINLREGEKYDISVTPTGYSFYNTTVNLTEKGRKKKVEADLQPLKKASKIQLNNIFFEFNSAELNEQSYKELNRVADLLKANPHIKMEVSAHTDDVGSEQYNLELSDKRARSVVEYLQKKGITQDKIISKGYGESMPAFLPENTEENRAKNRRVELKVVEINE